VGSIQSTPTSLLGGHRFGQCQGLEIGVQPGPRHQAGGRGGADLFGELGETAVFLGGEDALLDAQFAQRDLEHLEVGDLVDHRLHGAVVVVVVAHVAASSQCSGISVCSVSEPVPV
jgi:hypothetical protein